MAITLGGLAILVILGTPAEHLPGALLAYANLLLIGAAAIYFVQQRTLQGLIPVLFLLWFAAGWSLPTLYFATLFPKAVYYAYADRREILFGAVRVQSVGFAFLVAYLTTVLTLSGRYPPWTFSVATRLTDRRVGTLVLWIVMAAITLHAVSQVVPLPGPLVYVAAGSYNYLHGLMLLVGVLFLRLPGHVRLRALVFMALAAAFYLIGNARGLAVLPATLFVVGLIFLSDVSQRYKTWTVIVACAALPLALVIGNTTRTLLGSIGFTEIGARLDALGQWQEVLSNTPVLAATFHRLFFVGGHSIIAFSPEYIPYLDFSPAAYGWELLTRLLPGKLFYEPFYSTNDRLREYGFLITAETSYPMSLLGSLYMLGGVVPVILGGSAFGVFHALLGRGIGWANRRSRYLGLFIFSMIASTLIWSQNVDLIANFRVTAWRVLSALVLYGVILRPLAEYRTRRRLMPRLPAVPHWERRDGVGGGFAAGEPAPVPSRDMPWTPRA